MEQKQDNTEPNPQTDADQPLAEDAAGPLPDTDKQKKDCDHGKPQHGTGAVIVFLLAMSLVFLTVATLFAGYWKYFELASHFRFQIFLAHLPIVIFLSILRLPKTQLVTICSAAIHAVPLCMLYWPSFPPEAGEQRIKVLCANVLANNHEDSSRFDRLIEELDPDIIGVIEYSYPWRAKLEYLHGKYPHCLQRSAASGFGIALFSRIPIDDLYIKYLDAPWGKVPSIHGTLTIDGKPIHLALVHTLSPLERDRFESRNIQFEELTEHLSKVNHPVLMMGDLNCTTWSPYLRKMIHDLDLNDTRQGRGYQGSWPAPLWPLLIPIDHVLVSDGIVVTKRRLESYIGSDHYPVYFEFGVAAD